MILVFGTILQDIRIEGDQSSGDAQSGKTVFASSYSNSVGGKGALQALAAAKSGAKTALIGKTGDDELAKHILLRLRKHGVITSGVAKADKMQTGTSIYLGDEPKMVIGMGANAKASAEQVPEDVLNNRNVLLVQTELDMDETSKILAVAKEHGTRTILNLSPRTDITAEDLNNVDVLIAAAQHKATIKRLESYKHLTSIFLNKDGSCELHLKGGPATAIPRIKLDDIKWSHSEGAEDAFCGTFAACYHANMAMDKVLLRSLMAATLTASRKGAYDSIPYIDEVNSRLEELKASKD